MGTDTYKNPSEVAGPKTMLAQSLEDNSWPNQPLNLEKLVLFSSSLFLLILAFGASTASTQLS